MASFPKTLEIYQRHKRHNAAIGRERRASQPDRWRSGDGSASSANGAAIRRHHLRG